MGIIGGLNHKKRQDVAKNTRRNHHLQKKRCSIYEYQEKYVGFKNIKKNGLIFHYDIRSDPMLVLVMLLLDGYNVYVLHV